jgi:CRISPR/Cas system-associated exonuclease Cas4 (RecB family)
VSEWRSEIKNEVSFSASREKMLSRCDRQYWYHVYRSWKGWWADGNPPESKEAESAYSAKFIDSASSLSGRVVHECAAWGLRRAIEGKAWTREELRAALTSRASKALDKALKAAKARANGNPKKTTRLLEIEMGLDWDEDELRDRTRSRLDALTSDDGAWVGDVEGANLYTRAAGRPERIIIVDELLSYKVDGRTVYIAADLIMKAKEPRGAVVVDWKTGRPRDADEAQIVHYGAWAAAREFASVSMILAYLEEASVRSVAVGYPIEEARRMSTDRVRSFFERLSERLVDGDLDRNEPIEERFVPTADLSECARCPFQRICERDGAKPAKPDPTGGVACR